MKVLESQQTEIKGAYNLTGFNSGMNNNSLRKMALVPTVALSEALKIVSSILSAVRW